MSKARRQGKKENPQPYRYRITPAPPIPGAARSTKKAVPARNGLQRRGTVSGAATAAWVLLMVLPALALRRLCETADWPIVTGSMAVISLVTWLLYRGDKINAQSGERRTPESTLHLFELAGGWPAAFVAQRRFRHKIAKPQYQFTYWCIVILHELVALDYLLGWRLSMGFSRWARALAG